MTDNFATPAPATTPAADTSGANAGSTVTLEQLAAIVAALAGSVQTLTSQAGATQAFQTQIADGMKDLTEKVTNITEASDNDRSMASTVFGAGDQFTGVRHAQTWHDIVMGYVTFFQAQTMRQTMTHMNATPPLAPRSPTGPGTTGG